MTKQLAYLILIIVIVFQNNVAFSQRKDTVPKLSQDKFMYADNIRHTLTGELPNLNTRVKPLNFAVFSGATLGFMVTQHIIQVNTIWSETGEFRFIEDGDYALYADKAGHFYGAYLSSYFYSEFFMYSGFSYKSSQILGTILGLSYSTYVEIMDGFGVNWGFSPTDFYFDFAGSAFYILQVYVPYLQNFTPKFMFLPPNWHNENSRDGSTFFIDDYSSHSFFLSVNVNNMLPDNLEKYWPDWLQLSFGYAARDLINPFEYRDNPEKTEEIKNTRAVFRENVAGNPRYILALDYDLAKILPEGIPIWNWVRQTLNYIKLPSPAIEFGETTRVFLLYPFHF
jgi:hypothetical protein